MNFDSTMNPTAQFPEDLRKLDDSTLHVLNSKVLRELNVEYLNGGPEPETEFRREELTEELNRRDGTGRIPASSYISTVTHMV